MECIVFKFNDIKAFFIKINTNKIVFLQTIENEWGK